MNTDWKIKGDWTPTGRVRNLGSTPQDRELLLREARGEEAWVMVVEYRKVQNNKRIFRERKGRKLAGEVRREMGSAIDAQRKGL